MLFSTKVVSVLATLSTVSTVGAFAPQQQQTFGLNANNNNVASSPSSTSFVPLYSTPPIEQENATEAAVAPVEAKSNGDDQDSSATFCEQAGELFG